MQLIITEKPSVAKAICAALGIKDKSKHKGYIEGDERIVSWCYGHLVELAEPQAYGEQYKKWSYDSLPIMPEQWKHEVKPDTEEQFDILKKLMERNDVTELVEATDAGREGEAIFRLVYEKAGCNKPFKRLWISSMEEKAIREGFDNLKPGAEYDNLYHSARCRQEADWLVGINGTRLFSVLYGKTLKVGRVQTPTLAMLVNRETEIENFKKEPYYTVHILGNGLDAVSEKIKDKKAAEEIAGKCDGKEAEVVSVTKEDKTTAPPKLYDLTTLQRDANRLFGFTAKQTLEYTQSLYEKRLVTYPRTDSQYLSDDMGDTARDVLTVIMSVFDYISADMSKVDIKRILNSKKVTDHHAIIPTIEIGNAELETLPDGEAKILALTAMRLTCAVSEKHSYTTVKALLSCCDQQFTSNGKTVRDKGWKAVEDAFKAKYKTPAEEKEEAELPELTEGQSIKKVKAKVTEGFTQPPKHFTEDSLLSSMERAGNADMDDDVERKGLGTPATRADIIEKLVKDGFVKREKKNMLPTEDGVKLITVLPDMVKSAQLTAEWENKLSRVSRGEMTSEDFMEGIHKLVNDLVSTYHAISSEQKAVFGGEGHSLLGKCPRCGCDVISGKYGPYCTKKCGMRLGKAMGRELDEDQVKALLEGKKILLKGLIGKNGKTYDAYLTPKGIRDYSYTNKERKEISGFQYDYDLEFPKKSKR